MRRRGAPPLPRRRTDRVEDLVAWLLTTLGLFAAFGCLLVGHAAHQAALGLADNPPPPAVDQRVRSPRLRAPVVWTSPDGAAHVASVSLAPALPAGSAVTLWVDRAGRVMADPAERSAEALAFGITAGLTVVALSWALLTLAWSAVCRVTASCNAAGWAREWARVEPRWRRSVS